MTETSTAAVFVLLHEAGAPADARALVSALPAALSATTLAEVEGESAEALRGRIDEAAAGRPVIVAAHGHAVPALAAVVLADPAAFAGAAFVNGAFEPVEGAPLTGLPVFFALGEQDLEVPIPVQNVTWRWIISESGAPVTAHLDDGGHGPTTRTWAELVKWAEHRLARIAENGVGQVGVVGQADWSFGELPVRNSGGRPLVTWSVPQQQYTDQAMLPFQEKLFEKVSALDGVKLGDSDFAVPGARALLIENGSTDTARYLDAASGEFAHLHPWYDGSLHVVLPADKASDAITKGWAQPHMWAGTRFTEGFVLVYGPRNDAEVEIVAGIVDAGREYAAG
ncbi:phospholipase/carboxylesterase [Nocardioides daedukensis]|uniref:Phospholipase/carboxylesterase n=1 Tax=Nocardioides daedukensis TaxID=634462 RepID=A0A7Y9UU05_9ACTN|nr:luciferase family protein [Nocardioides daedukensis]NYG59639.1 phospholipase/carboxylesterase [Nocardioides daedukensis]